MLAKMQLITAVITLVITKDLATKASLANRTANVLDNKEIALNVECEYRSYLKICALRKKTMRAEMTKTQKPKPKLGKPEDSSNKIELAVGVILPDEMGDDHKTLLRNSLDGWLDEMFRKNPNYKLDWSKFDIQFYPLYFGSRSPTRLLRALCETLVERNVTAVIYLTNRNTAMEDSASVQYVQSIGLFLKIPVIAFSSMSVGAEQTEEEETLLELSPSTIHEATAFINLIQYYKWKGFTIITSTMPGADAFITTMYDLVRDLEEATPASEEPIIIHKVVKLLHVEMEDIEMELDSNHVYKTKQHSIAKTDTRIFVLYASYAEALKIFSVAKERGLLGGEFVWMCNHFVGNGESPTANEAGDIIQEKQDLPHGVIAINYDMDYRDYYQALRNALLIWGNGLLRFIKTQGEQGHEIKPNLAKASCIVSEDQQKPIVQTNTQLQGVEETSWRYGHKFYSIMAQSRFVLVNPDGFKEVVSFGSLGALDNTYLEILNFQWTKWKKLGYWTSDKGVNVREIRWSENRKTKPIGRPEFYNFRVVTHEEKPFVNYDDPSRSGACLTGSVLSRIAPLSVVQATPNATSNSSLYQCASGFSIEILKELAKRLTFKFELFEVEDKQWGSYNPNTSEWNGMIKTLIDRKADFAITSLSINPGRETAVDFTFPVLETGIGIAVVLRPGAISATAVLDPFPPTIWIMIIAVMVNVVSLALFFFEWASPYGYDRTLRTVDADHEFSLFAAIWNVWATLYAAAVDIEMPHGITAKIINALWAVFAMIFMAFYTANLTQFMIASREYYQISGVYDKMIQFPETLEEEFKYSTVPSGTTRAIMELNFPKVAQYWKNDLFDSVDKGVKAMKAGQIGAFLYDAIVLQYRSGIDDKCQMLTTGKWFAMTGHAIGFPVGSRWLEDFNIEILKLKQEGFMEQQRENWLKGTCRGNSGADESHPLIPMNFVSAFMLLGGGIILSFMLLILEHCYFRFLRSRLRNIDKHNVLAMVSLNLGQKVRSVEGAVDEVIKKTPSNERCSNLICNERYNYMRRQKLSEAARNVQLRRIIKVFEDLGGVSCERILERKQSIKEFLAKNRADFPEGDDWNFEKHHHFDSVMDLRRQRRRKRTMLKTRHSPVLPTEARIADSDSNLSEILERSPDLRYVPIPTIPNGWDREREPTMTPGCDRRPLIEDALGNRPTQGKHPRDETDTFIEHKFEPIRSDLELPHTAQSPVYATLNRVGNSHGRKNPYDPGNTSCTLPRLYQPSDRAMREDLEEMRRESMRAVQEWMNKSKVGTTQRSGRMFDA